MNVRGSGDRNIPLSQQVAEIVDDFEVPVPTGIVRTVASARLGRKVGAELLSRLAAAQREAFLRTRRSPLLCHALNPRGEAMRPRVWARADWRLGRRVLTSDSERGWRAALATGLLKEVVEAEGMENDALVGVALHAAAELLGPGGSHRPVEASEWEQLRIAVRSHIPEAGVTTLTGEQVEAEKRLEGAPAVALLFGRAPEEVLAEGSGPALVRLPLPGEEGEPFDRVLRRRLGGDPQQHSTAVAYLQGFSFIVDEWGRAPSSEEFADFWRFDLPSVKHEEAVFAKAFPEEDGPERLLRLLEEGLPRSGALRALLDTPVIDSAPPSSEVAPAAGQRWQSPDGEQVLTLIEAEGNRLTGGLHNILTGTSALWVGTRADIADWRLERPDSVWRVRFDVDVVPQALIGPLHKANVFVDRMRRPANPRPGEVGLRAGTIEGHLQAENEAEARQKVIDALRGHAQVERDQVFVQPLPSRIGG